MGIETLIQNKAKPILRDKKRLNGETVWEYAQRIESRLRAYGVKEAQTRALVYAHHLTQSQLKEAQHDCTSEEQENIEEIRKLVAKYKKFKETKIKTDKLTNFNEKFLIQTCINLVEDVRVLAVRVVEKLDEIQNSWMFPKQKREDIALRAMYLYAPLAKILGLSLIAKDLEDAGFKVLYPQEFYVLKRAIRKRERRAQKLFKDVEKALKSLLKEQGVNNFDIQHRVKSVYSTYKKLLRYRKTKAEEMQNNKGLEKGLDRIYDLIAFRIIVNSTAECYLVENLLTQLWNTIPGERDDYIKKPRVSGYQAIHNAYKIASDVIVEVQIKTHEMHQKAEFGISSHLLYKLGDKGQSSEAVAEFKKYLKTHPEWFRDLNYWEVQKTKGYIPKTPFSNKVYALTPKGDIVELPEGATVLDFAYALHTEIGNQCVGAFVNNKIVKLEHEIQTGDIVRIRTNPRKKKPSKDWLKIVKTRRAKIRIRKALEVK